MLLAPPRRSETTNWPIDGMKTRMMPATIPGMVSGTVTRKKVATLLAPRSSEASSRSEIELLERGVERQDHERQLAVDQADHDREVGVEEVQRLVDDAGAEQDGVDQPLGAQDEHPGVGADQEARPERDHHQAEQEVLEARRRDHRDVVGDRVAHHQAEQRGDDRHPQRAPVDREVERLDRAPVVGEEVRRRRRRPTRSSIGFSPP